MPIKQGNDHGPVKGFYQADADRIAGAVQWVESVNKDPIAERSYRRAYRSDPIPAKTKTGGIGAGSQTSPSTSTVTLLIPSGSGDGLTAGADVDILNYAARGITGSGKLIFLTMFNGKLIIPLPDC